MPVIIEQQTQLGFLACMMVFHQYAQVTVLIISLQSTQEKVMWYYIIYMFIQAKRCSTSQDKHLQLHMPQQRILSTFLGIKLFIRLNMQICNIECNTHIDHGVHYMIIRPIHICSAAVSTYQLYSQDIYWSDLSIILTKFGHHTS